MKRVFMLFLALLMTVLFCACGTAEPGAAQESSAAAVTEQPVGQTDAVPVQSEAGQQGEVTIEIVPPEGWEPVTGSILPVQYLKNTASFMVKEEQFTATTLDAIVNESLAIFEDTFENVIVKGDIETLTVDGKDARQVTLTCTVSGMDMEFLYVYLIAGGKTYTVIFGDLADTFGELSADYETILSNIRFKVQ